MKHHRGSYETRIGEMDAVRGRHMAFDRLQTEDGLVATIVKRGGDEFYLGALAKKHLSILDEDYEIAKKVFGALGLELSEGEYQTSILPNGLETQLDDSTHILVKGYESDRPANRAGYISSGILLPLGLATFAASPELVTPTVGGLALFGLIMDVMSYTFTSAFNADKTPRNKLPKSISYSLGYFPTRLVQYLINKYTSPKSDQFAVATDALELYESALRELGEDITESKGPMTLGNNRKVKKLNSGIERSKKKLEKLISTENNALVVTYHSTDKDNVVGFLEALALGEEPGEYASSVKMPRMRKRTKVVIA